jgi:hypothetical protein
MFREARSAGSRHNTATALFVILLVFAVFALAFIPAARELSKKTADAIDTFSFQHICVPPACTPRLTTLALKSQIHLDPKCAHLVV